MRDKEEIIKQAVQKIQNLKESILIKKQILDDLLDKFNLLNEEEN